LRARAPLVREFDRLSAMVGPRLQNPGGRAEFVNTGPTGGAGTGNVVARARGLNARDWRDTDFPALDMTLRYLDEAAGPVMRVARGGHGARQSNVRFAYNCRIVRLHLGKTTRPDRLFFALRDLLERIANSTDRPGPESLAMVRGTFLASEARAFSTPEAAAERACHTDFFHEFGEHFGRTVRDRGMAVTARDVRRMLIKYILPMFDPRTADLVVLGDAAMFKLASPMFRDNGFDLQFKQMEDFADDYDAAEPAL